MQKFSGADRVALIKLARSLPEGDESRRAILAGLSSRSAVFQVPPRTLDAASAFRKVLEGAGISGQGAVKAFNSGYVGVVLSLPFGKFLYLDQPGRVGLEDQASGYIAFGKYGRLTRQNALFWESYSGRSFGDVSFSDPQWRRVFAEVLEELRRLLSEHGY